MDLSRISQRNGIIFCAMTLIFVLGVLLSPNAHSHGVNIFAWVEGDTVHTQSSTQRGKPVINGEISVYDDQGAVVLSGVTDSSGKFSFTRPTTATLKIELLAGPGHASHWTLEASIPEEPVVPEHTHNMDKAIPPNKSISPKEIADIVDAALERRLAPLHEMVAATQARRNGVKEILGGLGYILGLVGVGAYVHYRQKAAALGKQDQRDG